MSMEDSKVLVELRQEPWVSKHILWKCQDDNFPSAANKVRPLGSKAWECGSEDTARGTSKAGERSHPVEDRELETTSLSLSQNEQFPPDGYFRKKVSDFFL